MSKYFLERGVAFSPEYFSTNISMSLWNVLYLYLLYLLYETLYEYMYMYLHTHTHTHIHTHTRADIRIYTKKVINIPFIDFW